MLKGKTVAVVVPAYNEEKQIATVIESMPDFVDRIVIVNDASTDRTSEVVRSYLQEDRTPICAGHRSVKVEPTRYNRADVLLEKIFEKEASLYTPAEIANSAPERSRVILINHLRNASVGGAIATGYKWCRDNGLDCTAVMAGDGQMDPCELESICLPVVSDGVDYVKGNRLRHRSAVLIVPWARYIGNSVLSLLTKIASGYWHVSDTQSGYTAISLKALESLNIHKIYKSYGCPNDILVKLNIGYCTVKEVDTKPIYNVGEASKMRILRVILPICFLLIRCFFERLYQKYLFRDFHPLFLLYHLAFVLLALDCYFLFRVAVSMTSRLALSLVGTPQLVIFTFLFISGLQSLFFAMWMDMMDNQGLEK